MDKVKGHLQGIMKHCRASNRIIAKSRSEEAMGVKGSARYRAVLVQKSHLELWPLVEGPYQLDHSQAGSEIRE